MTVRVAFKSLVGHCIHEVVITVEYRGDVVYMQARWPPLLSLPGIQLLSTDHSTSTRIPRIEATKVARTIHSDIFETDLSSQDVL